MYEQPNNNLGMALPNNYKVYINDNQEIGFYLTEIDIPDISIGINEIEHYDKEGTAKKKTYDGKYELGDVTFKFLHDSEMKVYTYFYGLIKEIIKDGGKNDLGKSLNITVILLTNKKNPFKKLKYINCKFNGISMGTYNNSGIQYKTIDITFSLEDFEIEDL